MSDIQNHASQVLELIREFERLENEPLREKIFELLEHIDHLHRSCVWRVFELATELGGKGLVDRMTQDVAVKTLFMLYDLVPIDPLTPVDATIRVTKPGNANFIPLKNVGGRKPSW